MNFVTELAVTTSNALDVAGDPFELGQDGDLMAPEKLPSDWLEMLLLAVMILIGAPLNTMALIRLQEVTRTSFIWLKIHLTVIDLIVILLYCPSHIGWLYTYVWVGGEFLCMAVQYSWDFCFHLMSLGVVSIAVDRLRTVYRLMHITQDRRSPRKQLQFVKKLIISCYVGAALFSVPQWFVWTTIDMKTWSQCTTIWHKLRALEYLHTHEFIESYEGERLYTMFHLLTVFWLPFIVLFIAYFYIVVYLFCYSIRPYALASDEPTNLLRHDAIDSNENLQLWPNCAGTPPHTFVNGSIRSGLTNGMVPAWRLEMRSKMFRTTIYVIAAYLFCWLPYNVLSLITFFSAELQIAISFHLELLRVCVLLSTVLNPFIYGFRD